VSDDLGNGLSGPWLAARLGVDPIALEARRRAGELFAVRPAGTDDWLYPGWQFGADWEVRPEVAAVLQAGREEGLSQAGLEALLLRRVGLADGKTMLELLQEGDDNQLLRAIKSSAASGAQAAT
jgi:hypothetical protein